MRDHNLCWYCQQKPKKEPEEGKEYLFCEDCEKIEKKEVNRAEQENFFEKV